MTMSKINFIATDQIESISIIKEKLVDNETYNLKNKTISLNGIAIGKMENDENIITDKDYFISENKIYFKPFIQIHLKNHNGSFTFYINHKINHIYSTLNYRVEDALTKKFINMHKLKNIIKELNE